jgi:hypothetical protein
MDDDLESDLQSPATTNRSTEQTPLLGGDRSDGRPTLPSSPGTDDEELSSQRLAAVFGSVWVRRLSILVLLALPC